MFFEIFDKNITLEVFQSGVARGVDLAPLRLGGAWATASPNALRPPSHTYQVKG